MEIGKLSPELLKKIVLNKLTERRSEVIVRSETGQDSVFIETNNLPMVTSTDPITGGVNNIGWFALHIACNDLAANGAEPIGVLITIMLPPKTTEEELEKIMDDASKAAKELNIDILGGHTEITEAVNRTVISTTAFGKPISDNLVISKAAKPDMDIILTKGAGIEGTAILASVKEEFLKDKMEANLLEAAKLLEKKISVVPESIIATKIGTAAMHDVTEGGVLGALYEVVQASECGFKVFYDKIPILESTKKICNIFEIDPLRLISSGSMLIFTNSGDEIVMKLKENKIDCAIIGKTIADKNHILVKNNLEIRIEEPQSDELWKII
ncbi:MAG: AIR synthase family protein [Clostridia bacterium]